MKRRTSLRVWLSLTWLIAAMAPQARAAENAPFEWKRLNIFIGTTTGGGYDAYGRLMARHIGKYLPGHPTVVPMNRPGAGGLAMFNSLFNTGARDGTEIGISAPGSVIDRVLYGDQSHAQFEAARFNWIGSIAEDPSVFVAWRDRGIHTDDIFSGKQITVGAPGPSGTSWLYSRALKSLFGSNLNIISGYPGTAEVFLGIEKGEVDGIAGITWNGIRSLRPQWFSDHKADVLLQYGEVPRGDLAEVPTVYAHIRDATTRGVMDILAGLDTVIRPVMAPPDVAPDRIATIRHAFDEMVRDPEFLAEARQQKLPVVPLAGAEVQAIMAHISAPSDDVVARLRQIFRE